MARTPSSLRELRRLESLVQSRRCTPGRGELKTKSIGVRRAGAKRPGRDRLSAGPLSPPARTAALVINKGLASSLTLREGGEQDWGDTGGWGSDCAQLGFLVWPHHVGLRGKEGLWGGGTAVRSEDQGGATPSPRSGVCSGDRKADTTWKQRTSRALR